MAILTFPFELMVLIADELYSGPCTLRRHITDKLLEQSAFRSEPDLLSLDNKRDDLAIRKQAYNMMDRHEKALFNDKALPGVARISSEWNIAARQAEKSWLTKRRPMNLAEFKQFCEPRRDFGCFDVRSCLSSEPKKYQHLVLELFPLEDLTDPLAQLTDLTETDRTQLRRRHDRRIASPPRPYTELDEQVCRALLEVWTAAIPRLP